MRIEENVINVIFDPGKGSVTQRSREATVGRPIGDLPTPTRPGFRFDGWYLGDTRYTADTPVTAEEDLRLVARWVKRAGDQKKITMYKKQKTAAIVLCVVAVVLALALVVTNQIVSIYGLTDTYYGADGTEYTEKYYVRKKDGVYALYSRDGERMKTDEDGNYLAKSGNVYAVDPETGEYTLFAIVDYDGANGEVLNAQKTRVMMFKRISQDNIQSIKVTNEKGSFEFYRDENGQVQIRGVEDAVVSYDAEAFAGLCVDAGYTLSMQKLDFTSPYAPKKPDGSIDYDAYGLEDRYDENGKLVYTPAVYEITGIPDNETQPVTHKVQVGESLVSGGGYYVRRVGYDAVYIMDSGLGDTVLTSVENMVIPMIVYPTSSSLYLEAYEFVLGKADIAAANGNSSNLKLDVMVSFTAQELAARLNTLYTGSPYIPASEPFASMPEYAINDYNVSEMLGYMFEMEFLACCQLGITNDKGALLPEVMEKYNLKGKVHYISYKSPMIDSSGQLLTDEDGEQLYALNQLIVSPKTDKGTYYVASLLCDMVVEVDQHYMSFLEWEISDWYHQYFYSYAMAYVQELGFTMGDKTYNFKMDNTLSYAFYNKDGTMTQVDLTYGKLNDLGGGKYSYTDKNGATHEVKFIDFSRKDAFVYQSGNVYYVDEAGMNYKLSTSASNVKVYMDEYTGQDGSHLLDYVITNTYINDKGELKTEQVSAVDNFRRWVIMLAYASIEGDVNPEEFEANLGMSIKDYIAQGEGVCQATLTYKVKDMASVANQYYTKDENGNSVKLWTEDNEREVIIRFYRYSERKSLMTIETVESYDANGNPITDPTKGVGSFYVQASYIEELQQAVDNVLNQVLNPED